MSPNLYFQNFIAYYWNNLGVPKEKINIGIPFYGRSFNIGSYTHQNAVKEGLLSSGPGNAGTFTKTNGLLAYYEVKFYINFIDILFL